MMLHNKKKTEGKGLLRLWTLVVVFAMLFSFPISFAYAQENEGEGTGSTATEETAPEETVPEETVPDETVPNETVPDETVPGETVPDETVPEETVGITFYYPDRTETVSVPSGSSFAQMYPGIPPETLVAEKEQHTFLGWFVSRDGGKTFETETFDFWGAVTGNIELYPQFQRNIYTVTFVLEGETLSSVTVEHGMDAVLPEIPPREGFTGAWSHDGRGITADTVITLEYTRTGSGHFLTAGTGSNFGGGRLSESAETLASAIPLTEQERILLEEGSDVTVRLELSGGDASASAADRALVEQILGELTLGMYLEASLFKQVGQEQETKLEQLNGSVTVSFVLPEDLLPADGSVRAFSVIRVHDGAAEQVDTVYNREKGVLSFTSDRFSTFAVAYTDTTQAPPAVNPGTGDGFAPGLWFAVAFACLAGTVALIYEKKKIM